MSTLAETCRDTAKQSARLEFFRGSNYGEWCWTIYSGDGKEIRGPFIGGSFDEAWDRAKDCLLTAIIGDGR